MWWNHLVHRLSIGKEISWGTATDWIFWWGKRKDLSVYYQQFPHCSIFNRRNIQVTVADWTIFQMDQAEFEDQKLSRDKWKCCNVSNLGGNDSLSADCLSQIYAWIQIWDDELTNRIRDTLMQNQSLLEVLSLDRKILERPPNWKLPVQEELFSPLLLWNFYRTAVMQTDYYK